MIDLKLGRRAFTLAVVTAPAGCAPEAALAQTPPRPQPQRPSQPARPPAEVAPLRRGPGDLAVISLRAALPLAAGQVRMAHAFPPGVLPRDGRLELRFEGERDLRPVQVKVLSRHPDGSARTAIIALGPPALRADRFRTALLSLSAAPPR